MFTRFVSKSKRLNKTSQTVGIEYKDNEDIIIKPLTINDAEGLLQVTDHNRNPLKMKDNGLYITEKMSQVNNLKVGDIVEWHIIGTDNMTDYIFKNAIGDSYDFEAKIKNITFIMSAIGTFVVVYITNQFLAKKIKKIDMVSSLKGNE